MADVGTHAQNAADALRARERACSWKLRFANCLCCAGVFLAAGTPPVHLGVWVAVALLTAAGTAALQLWRRARLVLVMTGYAATYARFEGLWYYHRDPEVLEGVMRRSDLWVGRLRLAVLLPLLCLVAVGLGARWVGVGPAALMGFSPAPFPLPMAVSCWVSVALWRLHFRREVARVARVDSFRLMEQEGYRWTWWGGWVSR